MKNMFLVEMSEIMREITQKNIKILFPDIPASIRASVLISKSQLESKLFNDRRIISIFAMVATNDQIILNNVNDRTKAISLAV